MNKKKKNIFVKILYFVLFTVLLICCPTVLKGQEVINNFSPLTAQQIEYCDGNQLYVNFPNYGKILFNWEDYVFNLLQHNNPIKEVCITHYVERLVYDEPTMVKNESMSDVFYFEKGFFYYDCYHPKLLQYSGFEAPSWTEADEIINAGHQKTKKNIVYKRDEKNRVIRATRMYGNQIGYIVDFSYRANSDYISTIKHYDLNGKLTEEIKYNHLTLSGKTLLKDATYKYYEHFPNGSTVAKRTYIYRLNYSAAGEVNNVDLFFEENMVYKKTDNRKNINVTIVRDSNNNIKTCTCKEVKYEITEYDKDGKVKSYKNMDKSRKSVSWLFTYDKYNNWITMTRTFNQNGKITKDQIKRDLCFDKSTALEIAPDQKQTADGRYYSPKGSSKPTQTGKSGYKQTANGLYYKFITQNEGETLKVGDVAEVVFSYSVQDTTGYDTLLFSSKEALKDKPFNDKIQESIFVGDYYEGLRLMHKGDSISMYINVDSVFIKMFGVPKDKIPKFIKPGSDMRWEVKVVDFK